LDETLMKPRMEWLSFSKEKFRNTIKKYNNLSVPGLDYVLWKFIVDNNKYLFNIVNITNAYIDLSYWLLYFKMPSLIIIPKFNKMAYNSQKMFWLIILLNLRENLLRRSLVRNYKINLSHQTLFTPINWADLNKHSSF